MSATAVLLAVVLHILLLFGVAFYADRRRLSGRSIISNSMVYLLSFGVWHTSWTFYGNVGRVATVGIDFIALYIAATMVLFCGWFLLRKMVRISKEQNLVSIADFLASRYGNSPSLGALVTVVSVAVTLPYIALQLKAIVTTFELMTRFSVASQAPPAIDSGLVVAGLLSLFAILFGARSLDPSARHEGLVAAVAFESLLKLLAMAAVGLFFTYGLFDGFSDLFARFSQEFPDQRELLLLGTERSPFSGWFALMGVGALAFVCLPHLFHLMVVENADEEHIKTAMWGFPLYMFLTIIFIIPIALGGLLFAGGDTTQAEYFPLLIPLQEGAPGLALVVFLGGFSGATGMVLVAAVALSTMVLNHLLMPVILKVRPPLADLSGLLLFLKRFGIVAVIFFSYIFYRGAAEGKALINIGLISFVGVAQFAPALLGGLFWKGASLKGARAGLLLGFFSWFYIMVIPSMIRGGWFESQLLESGPFGVGWLRPEALFGFVGLPPLPYVLFWTLFLNLLVFGAVSLWGKTGRAEQEQAEKFVDVFLPRKKAGGRQRITSSPTIIEFVELMTKFIGEKRAGEAIEGFLVERTIDLRGSLSERELARLKQFVERTLAGSVGAAPARIIIENYLETRGSRMEEVFDIFGSVTISRRAGREQLGILHEAARRVAEGSDQQRIFDSILELLKQQFRFDLCVIRMLDEERSLLTVRSQNGHSSGHFATAPRGADLQTYVGETFTTENAMVENDTDFLRKPTSAQMIHKEGIKAFAHAPITVDAKTIGVLSAYSRTVKGIFSDEFMELFTNLAGQVGVAWRNARQTERLIRAREQDREMQIARQIQTGLLPGSPPEVSGLSMAGLCLPAREVGGDYYDFFLHGRDTLDLLIADVSGHNVGAALMMAATRTFIRSRGRSLQSIPQAMAGLNDFLYDDLSRAELFISMFYARYERGSRTLSFANAGHNRPLLWKAESQSCQWLDAEGLLLGIIKNVDFEEKKIELQPGDVLLLYTDGITEAEREGGELFGDERLAGQFAACRHLSPQQVLERLLEQAREFSGQKVFNDDVSLVMMRVEGDG